MAHGPVARRGVPVALALVLAAVACGDGAGGAAAGSPRGRTFLSTSASRDLVAGTRIVVEFDDGEVSASADCNTMSGPADLDGGRIVLSELSMTQMGCDPARHGQDDWLADVLLAEPSYTLDGDRLRIVAGTATIDLVDRRTADPDRPLEGTVWRLEGLLDGELAGSVPEGAAATLRFAGGRVTVEIARCNQGGGTAEIARSEIRVGSLVMTDMACTGAPAEAEAIVLAALHGTVRYEIEATSLTVTNPNGKGITLRAAG